MHVTVEIPHQGTSGLDAAIAKQFADIQRQLMALSKASEASTTSLHAKMLDGLAEQHDAFMEAMERLMSAVSHAAPASERPDALTQALKGLNATMATLPASLKSSLSQSARRVSQKTVTSTPRVTVALPAAVTQQLDTLEAALMEKPRGFSHRTFGSNY